MKCHKTKSKTTRNKLFLLVCLLVSVVGSQACGKPKDDIFVMLTKMEVCLQAHAPHESAWEHWHTFRDNTKESLHIFTDIKKYPTHSFAAQIDRYKQDLARCQALLNNSHFAPIHPMLQALHSELLALIEIVEPYRNAKSAANVLPLGIKMDRFEYLMPKHMRKGIASVLIHRIKQN